MKTLDSTEARKRYSEILSRVQYGHERIMLSRNGKPAVALVPAEDVFSLDNHETLFALQDALEDMGAALKKQGKRLPAPLARTLRLLDKIEGRLWAAVRKRIDEEDTEPPVPLSEVCRELGR